MSLCNSIPEINQFTPILMLTALRTTDYKLDGFGTGEDDCIVKPFDFRELIKVFYFIIPLYHFPSVYRCLGDKRLPLNTTQIPLC